MEVQISTDLRPSVYVQRLVLWEAATAASSQRQRAQNALAESEARFRALAEASSALIWQLDAQGSAILPP